MNTFVEKTIAPIHCDDVIVVKTRSVYVQIIKGASVLAFFSPTLKVQNCAVCSQYTLKVRRTVCSLSKYQSLVICFKFNF